MTYTTPAPRDLKGASQILKRVPVWVLRQMLQPGTAFVTPALRITPYKITIVTMLRLLQENIPPCVRVRAYVYKLCNNCNIVTLYINQLVSRYTGVTLAKWGVTAGFGQSVRGGF